MKNILLAIFLCIICFSTKANEDNQYTVAPDEMDMPKYQEADTQTIDTIETDLGVSGTLFPESADDITAINPQKKSLDIKDLTPKYEQKSQSIYAITQDSSRFND